MSKSKLEDHKQEFIELVHRNFNNQEIANILSDRWASLDVSRHSVRRFKDKLGLTKGAEKESTKIGPNDTTLISDAGIDTSDPDKVVRDRGLDPDEWEYNSITVNEWDSPTGETLRQLKINLTRKEPILPLIPARTDGPKWEKPKDKPVPDQGILVFITGDDQAPFQDPGFHDKKCQLISEVQPDHIVKIGDTNDFPTISKYKKNPEIEERAKVEHCIDAGYQLLRDEREAAPNAKMTKLIGNHDVRLRDYVIAFAPELHGFRRAIKDGQVEPSVFSPEFYMRLDELGIDLVGDNANYEHGELKLSKYLATRHGWIATKGSGSSALKTLEHLGYSILVGHTHRLSLVHKTTYDIDGELEILAAAETGCGCRIDKEGLGYTPSPDWQHGGATAQIYPDGTFHIDLINWIDGSIYWRGSKF